MEARTTSGTPPRGPADPDRELYRRRQRRRALIGWSVGLLVVALVVFGIVLGGEGRRSSPSLTLHLFAWEMTSLQYQSIHKGEGEQAVVEQLGSSGLREDEVPEDEVLRMFPTPPRRSSCSFWKLSDAPDHLVRLCFRDGDGVLLQKAVRAPGESGAETTLV